MKTKRLIIIALTIFAVNSVFAQRYKSKPINSGYVFINGQYISPPYHVEQKETGYIYINNVLANIRLRRIDTVPNPYRQDYLPEIPKSINKNTTYLQLISIIDSASNRSFLRSVAYYYHTHYKEKKANKKIKEFYESLPNMKTVKGGNGMIYIETYAEQEGHYVLVASDFIPHMYERYGIHSHYKTPTEKELRQRTEKEVKKIYKLLSKDFAIFFKCGEKQFNNYRAMPGKIFYDKAKRFYSGNMSYKENINLLYQMVRPGNPQSLDDILNNEHLKKRIMQFPGK